MNAQLLAAAILLQVAKAAWSDDVAAVSSDAAVLSGSVAGWSSADGLQGALGIQGYVPTLSSALAALSDAAGSLSASDIDVDATNSLVSAVSGLLSALSEKAGDFNAVGAGSIVGNDLKELAPPSAAVVSDIIKVVSDDCAKLGSLTSGISVIGAAFSSAAAALSVDPPNFPSVPSCKDGSGSSAGSSAHTSAVGSSAATSAANSVAVKTSAASGSGVAVANNGNKAAAAAAAVGAGVVAMLI